jgi:hypothetical protein
MFAQDVLAYVLIRLFVVFLSLSVLLMSENKLDNSYFSIPDDAMIDIKVSGKFYTQLKSAFTEHLMDGENKDSMGVILTNISQNKVANTKELRLLLLYVLTNQIEAAAIEQNLADVETPTDPEESPQS